MIDLVVNEVLKLHVAWCTMLMLVGLSGLFYCVSLLGSSVGVNFDEVKLINYTIIKCRCASILSL